MKGGGRYNPPNEFGALYTSLDAATATKEAARGLAFRGIDPTQFPVGARWVYELEVKLEAVIDLSDSAVLEKLGLDLDALTGSDVRITRSIAAQARSSGYQALIAPSAASPGSKNLIVFVDNLTEPPVVLTSRPVDFQSVARTT